MPHWEIGLTGDSRVLSHLASDLHESDLLVRQRGEAYFLVSARLDHELRRRRRPSG